MDVISVQKHPIAARHWQILTTIIVMKSSRQSNMILGHIAATVFTIKMHVLLWQMNHTVTIHYINKDWQRKSAVLDTSEMDESHSTEDRLDLVQTDWNLEGKITVCVQDNAFTQAATRRLLEDWVLPTHCSLPSTMVLPLKK